MIRAFLVGLSFEETDLPGCLEDAFTELVKRFESVELTSALKLKTKAFKEVIASFPQGDSVTSGVSIERGFSVSPLGPPPKSPFKGDLKISCKGPCKKPHTILVELCLNNIIAIGTHFLKVESAAGFLENDTYGVLVCLTREFLSAGNWDASYADDIDHIQAYELAYKPFLREKMAVLQLRLA